jgi:hypothetical protein
MKLLWISPRGEGIDLATRVRAAGNQVVVYGEGAGLPLVQQKDLYKFAELADLCVIDGSFPLVRTRRSWRPHQDALFFDELRRAYGVKALGPTPTVDLLVGDRRYLRKWCAKLGIAYQHPGSNSEVAGLDDSAAGDNAGGQERASVSDFSTGAWFRGNDIIPPGPLLSGWAPLFKSVGFRGYFELVGSIGANGPVISRASATWPTDIPEGAELDFLLKMSE